MGMVISPDSDLGRELEKWEQHRTKYVSDDEGHEPGNRYVFRPFPAMMYKAVLREQGQVVCIEPQPAPHLFADMAQFERACHQVDSFNRSNMRQVHSAGEKDRAWADGWRDSPVDALNHHEALRKEMADAAAEAGFHAQRMSARANAELQAADASTSEHVVDVQPARKRGRPAKGQIAISRESEG